MFGRKLEEWSTFSPVLGRNLSPNSQGAQNVTEKQADYDRGVRHFTDDTEKSTSQRTGGCKGGRINTGNAGAAQSPAKPTFTGAEM